MKKSTLKIVLLVLFFVIAEIVVAQTPPGNRPPAPPGLPIDGGIFTLFAVAFGYAIKKLRIKKEQ